MTRYKYAIKRAKLSEKARAAFDRGAPFFITNYWNKRIHRLDFKYYKGRNNEKK